MQLPLRCIHRVLHFFEAVATSRTYLLIKRKTSIDPDMQMMWGRHLKAVLDGVILQDTVHYFSLDVEQKILQCFILGLTTGQRRAMGAEGVTKTRGASLYAGSLWKIASASMVEARTTAKKKKEPKLQLEA